MSQFLFLTQILCLTIVTLNPALRDRGISISIEAAE